MTATGPFGSSYGPEVVPNQTEFDFDQRPRIAGGGDDEGPVLHSATYRRNAREPSLFFLCAKMKTKSEPSPSW